MQILKFGGTSVANAENILKTIAIVQKAVAKGKTMVVVSALGGTTDMLIDAGKLAASGNEAYKEKLNTIEQRHLQTATDLIADKNQSLLLVEVKNNAANSAPFAKVFFITRII